MHVVATEH